MPFRQSSRPAPDQIEAIIGPRATFDGRLRCDGSVRVDGTLEGGTIEALGNVLITESARVMADIKAKTVSVAGAYKGTITADRVELLEGGRLWGTIKVRTFLLDEGAHFEGQLVMQGAEGDQQLLAPQPPAGEQISVQSPEIAAPSTDTQAQTPIGSADTAAPAQD